MSVVPAEAGRGPLNIGVDREVMRRLWPVAAKVRIGLGRHLVRFPGRLELDLRGSDVYDPSGMFAAAPLPRGRILENLAAAIQCTVREGHMEGMGDLLLPLLERRDPPPLNPFAAAALPRVRALLLAIKVGDSQIVREVSSHLVGLGIGLTPSGDDLLSGLMVAHVLGSINGLGLRDPAAFTKQVVRASKGRTTLLSFEYLLQASKGRANEHVAAVVESIFTSGEGEVATATKRAISIGETSGTDTLVGVCVGVRSVLDVAALPGRARFPPARS